MSKKHTVDQGDTMIGLAERYGHFVASLWDDPNNRSLKEKRNPKHCLLPGDVVTIPDKRSGSVTVSSDSKHKFRRKGIPAIYRLQVFDHEKVRANQSYRLIVDGTVINGITNADGILEEALSARAQSAELYIGPDNFHLCIRFGYLDPPDTTSGVQQRLNNLGYRCGQPDGMIGTKTQAALRHFQKDRAIKVTGQIDEFTLDVLDAEHDTVSESHTHDRQASAK